MPVIVRPDYRTVQDPEVKELIDHFSRGKFAEITDQADFFDVCTKSERETIAKEIFYCQEDFRYAAKNYFWIVSKDSVDQLFSLWPAQELILDALQDLKEKGRPQKLIVIKARQLGCSILSEALGLWNGIYFPNRNGLIVSYDQTHSSYLFGLMQGIYKNLPLWMKPYYKSFKMDTGIIFDTPLGENPARKPGLNCSIRVEWATKLGGVGEGVRLNFAHLSEFPSWRNARSIIEEDLKHALVQDPNTIAILESTAKGAGTYSHELWNRMVELGEEASWSPRFLPWFFERTRVLAPPMGWRPNSDSVVMKEAIERAWVKCSNKACSRFHDRMYKHRDRSDDTCPTCGTGILVPYLITNSQSYWMEYERKNAENVKAIKQELATTAEEAFITSSDPIFPEACQDFVNFTVCDPKCIGFFNSDDKYHGIMDDGSCPVEGCKMDHRVDGLDIHVWEFPKKKATYYIGVDVARGVGGDKDFSVIWVNRIDRISGVDVHVCTYRSSHCDVIDLAIMAAKIGKWYNDAEIAVEFNGLSTTADWLRVQLQYPNLYRKKNNKSKNILTNTFAWETNASTKPKLVVNAVRALRLKTWIVRDKRFATEIKTFTKESEDAANLANIGAAKGFHDDLIMAGLICLFCSHEMDWDEDLGFIPARSESAATSTWAMHCDSCTYLWGTDDPRKVNGCPKCGSLHVVGRKNIEAAINHAETALDDYFERATRPDGDIAYSDL